MNWDMNMVTAMDVHGMTTAMTIRIKLGFDICCIFV